MVSSWGLQAFNPTHRSEAARLRSHSEASAYQHMSAGAPVRKCKGVVGREQSHSHDHHCLRVYTWHVSMSETEYAPIRALLARTQADDALHSDMLADPVGTIQRETGVVVPDGWELIASTGAAGAVVLELNFDEIPDEALDQVAGGLFRPSFGFPPLAVGTINVADAPVQRG